MTDPDTNADVLQDLSDSWRSAQQAEAGRKPDSAGKDEGDKSPRKPRRAAAPDPE